MIVDINKKKKTQILKFPLTSFGPNEKKVIFEKNNVVGVLKQLTFEVNANNSTTWKNTKIKIYIEKDDEPDLVLTSDDIVHGIGYNATNKRMLDVSVYRYSNGKKSKVSIKLDMDFLKKIKIEAVSGNGNTTIGVWGIYQIYYYMQGD